MEIARHNHTLDVEIQDGVAAGAMAAGPVIWAEGAAPLVRRADVTQAQREMGSALHHQLLRSRSTWDKLLLVAVIVEARATGRSAGVMQVWAAFVVHDTILLPPADHTCTPTPCCHCCAAMAWSVTSAWHM